jgi:hypothetical protein
MCLGVESHKGPLLAHIRLGWRWVVLKGFISQDFQSYFFKVLAQQVFHSGTQKKVVKTFRAPGASITKNFYGCNLTIHLYVVQK